VEMNYYMGDRDLASVVLSRGERDILRKASALLFDLRTMRHLDDDDPGIDIALAAHVCHDIAEEGEVTA